MQQGRLLELENFCLLLEGEPINDARTWNISSWPVRNEGSRLIGFVLMMAEVSERVRLMEHQEDVYSAIAHDIKNSIIGISSALQSMLSEGVGSLSNEQTEALTVMQTKACMFQEMMQKLVPIYRFKSGTPALILIDVNLVDLIM